MGYLGFLHGGNIYEIERKYKRKVIDFSANINPLGLPRGAKETIYKNFDKVLHYPDSEPMLIKIISKYWNVSEENILLGNGSVELIYLIAYTFKPETVLIPVPTFSEYERAARTVKSKIEFLKLEEPDGFSLNIPRTSLRDMLFLCNPNNPTGNLILKTGASIDKLPGRLTVVDEAFMDFLPDSKKHTLIARAVKEKKIIVIRTLTKFFALPGLRIGYLFAHKEIINKLREHQPPWSVNSLAQLAGQMILTDKNYIEKTYELIAKERDFLFKQIVKIESLKAYPSATNFLLVKIENKKLTSSILTKRLIERGLLIRDCTNFRGLGDKFFRIAVRTRKENSRLLMAMSSAVAI